MADETQDDKTEEPTQRRMEKAREDGQVLRSQDATMAAVTIMVIAVLYFGGYWFADSLVGLFEGALAFDTIFALEPALAIGRLGDFLGSSLLSLVPLFVLAMITAVGTAAAIGGFVFSGKAVAPKFSKLNPLKGMARIFGLKALVELIKAVLKFSLVGS
ncbi:MAG TPA: flagellar biosynthesis protein FlhB, partial [Gammaproteobacteria bacterium]|nr:flagellar biosynthesis protein FlhB [Gammaproteobacteria bacterium]